ncbi:hypothetical protein FH972_026158 [Carpinus fangiana]|uniref:Uncharacterized protein n=1 Tax=Carpinus fangiana TaxID=176857 RepID=A0A5N6L450_9ROSI|nr:hypothetical protein FH972_026158 [Carpinus fangiana]
MAPARRRPPARSSRSSGQRISYREASTDDSDDFARPETVASPRPAKRTRTSRPAAPAAPVAKPPASPFTASPRRKTTFAKPRRHALPQRPAPPQRHIPSDGVIPNWADLPYEILCSIFRYASHPLRNDALQHTPARHWLCQAARICKGFCEPALAALYYDPPLDALPDPFALLDLVTQDQSTLTINYKTKVKRLELMARDTLAYTMPGRGLFDLSSLLPYLPQLREMYIKELGDLPPFRMYGGPRQGYLLSPKLWQILRDNPNPLTGWRWNCSMMSLDANSFSYNYPVLLVPPGESRWFLFLKHLEVARILLQPTNDNVRGSPEPDPAKDVSAMFIKVIKQIPGLESLTLESCVHKTWDFLTILPRTIKSIKIVNTPYLSSEAMLRFMETHGAGLESLDLSHNQYLDLAFLADLRRLCPNLRFLKMDATYYSAVALQNDSEPIYDSLLLPEDVPTWPDALVSIELTNLRKWELEAVQVFFGSLIRAAPQLPKLRHIVIRAMLSIGWRDRAGFRDKYIGTLKRIYERHSPLPDPHLASLRAHKLYKEALGKRSTIPSAPLPVVEADIPVAADGKALRRSSRAKVSYNESDESDSDVIPNRDAIDGVSSIAEFKHVPVQGLCDIVDVNIDNLRPAEVQFKEADFVDSEISGDEDWTEGRERERQERSEQYAW